ncbi:MAG: hypothetical protein PF501_06270 [Salinisphaera sp.]|jgi:hypothetical protein|nr:hypothetical protein [Salinisphaera sp.]
MGDCSIRARAVVMACIALVCGGCAHISSLGKNTPGPTIDHQSSCVPMKWVRYKDQAKAAVTVPILLDGQREWFQLDTGTPYTALYGKQNAMHYGFKPGTQSHVEIGDVRLAGLDLGGRSLRVPESNGPGVNINGTLGLDLLVGHLVILDFKDDRFCMDRDATPSKDMARGTQWAKGALRDGHLFFDLNAGDRVLKNILFDTGSSNIVLWVDRSDWTHLTGIDNPEKAERLREGLHWGKRVTMASAPAKDQLRLGHIIFGSQTVSTLVEKPDFFANFANGLFGNAPFLGNIVVLSLGPTPALGVVRGSNVPDDR